MKAWFAVALLALAAWGKEVPKEPPKFSLADTAGAMHTDAEWKTTEVVLYFITTDCPISNGYVPEMNRIAKEYSSRGVKFYGVITDTSLSAEVVRKHVKDFGYTFPVLLDPTQILVSYTNADTNPEAAVITPRGVRAYLGRIDNKVAGFGAQRPEPTERDLRNAIDATLAGKPAPKAVTTPIGCSIVRVK
jgi:peroxiredoxin